MARIFSRRRFLVLLLSAGSVLAVAVFYLLAQAGIGIPCLFRLVTGLLCPGCGNSRAALCLMRLDIAGAFAANPLFLPEFLYLAWVYLLSCKSYLSGGRFSYRPPWPAVDIILLGAVVLWWIVRNLL